MTTNDNPQLPTKRAPGRPKGLPKTGGRKKGLRKAEISHADLTDIIGKFLRDHAPKLWSWIEMIAKKNPQAAFSAYCQLLEYGVPKLSRKEVTGKDGGALEMKNVTAVDQEILNSWEREIQQKTQLKLKEKKDVELQITDEGMGDRPRGAAA